MPGISARLAPASARTRLGGSRLLELLAPLELWSRVSPLDIHNIPPEADFEVRRVQSPVHAPPAPRSARHATDLLAFLEASPEPASICLKQRTMDRPTDRPTKARCQVRCRSMNLESRRHSQLNHCRHARAPKSSQERTLITPLGPRQRDCLATLSENLPTPGPVLIHKVRIQNHLSSAWTFYVRYHQRSR